MILIWRHYPKHLSLNFHALFSDINYIITHLQRIFIRRFKTTNDICLLIKIITTIFLFKHVVNIFELKNNQISNPFVWCNVVKTNTFIDPMLLTRYAFIRYFCKISVFVLSIVIQLKFLKNIFLFFIRKYSFVYFVSLLFFFQFFSITFIVHFSKYLKCIHILSIV